MKIFTHTYRITLFDENGFCWKRKGWVKKSADDLVKDKIGDFVVIMVLLVLLSLAT